jgi:hypothetical protein
MIDLYLQQSLKNEYVNTEKEQELLNKFSNLYISAKAEQDKNRFASSENLKLWRKSYEGTLGALNKDGKTESKKTSRQLRKMVFELVESKVDNTVPMPKITPRYKSDLPIVNVTEHYLKYEIDNALSKFNNDRSERSTYVDGTSWYKVWWDSLDNTHERSGNVRVDVRTVDQIVPQPGVVDYKQLEYIFEIQEVPVSKIYKLYNRVISASGETPGSVKVISCYYLNDDGIVGLFTWCPESGQVICNEENWQIRKLRT